ncbi:MAG: hypothetical protein LBU11_02575 [Zoogloeaceae bacterium]|nr:hypothetical protein [Zoogloeaceae bacterium]
MGEDNRAFPDRQAMLNLEIPATAYLLVIDVTLTSSTLVRTCGKMQQGAVEQIGLLITGNQFPEAVHPGMETLHRDVLFLWFKETNCFVKSEGVSTVAIQTAFPVALSFR